MEIRPHPNEEREMSLIRTTTDILQLLFSYIFVITNSAIFCHKNVTNFQMMPDQSILYKL